MPEGDTIFRTARSLHRALATKVVVRVELPRLGPTTFASGTTVDAVDPVGKHCLVRFSDGRVLRTHLQMSGSWHLYRPGERWRRSPGAMRALVEVADWVAVCFSAPVVELSVAPAVDHLGPDLCRPDVDLDAAADRFDRFVDADTQVKVALLDQRVAAGIGNVYASEVCFADRLDPRTPLAEVAPARRRRLLELASGQLRANLDQTRRVTFEGGLAVYGRAGRPCRRCGTPVAFARLGPEARGTYWCPTCQPPGGTGGPGGHPASPAA